MELDENVSQLMYTIEMHVAGDIKTHYVSVQFCAECARRIIVEMSRCRSCFSRSLIKSLCLMFAETESEPQAGRSVSMQVMVHSLEQLTNCR